MKQPITFLVWTENTPGVLIRLASLFSRRKINIDSLTVSETEVYSISRFTLVITVEAGLAATIGRQIERMIEVRRVIVSTEPWVVHREIVMFRAKLSQDTETSLRKRYAALRVIEKNDAGYLIEFSGTTDQIDAISDELRENGLSEFVRSGRIALTQSGNYEHDLARSLHELRAEAHQGPDF
jgi:acetolactate synthase-1/3 small subunit